MIFLKPGLNPINFDHKHLQLPIKHHEQWAEKFTKRQSFMLAWLILRHFELKLSVNIECLRGLCSSIAVGAFRACPPSSSFPTPLLPCGVRNGHGAPKHFLTTDQVKFPFLAYTDFAKGGNGDLRKRKTRGVKMFIYWQDVEIERVNTFF